MLYHYKVDQYWDLFSVREVEQAPEYDGHTPEQALDRIVKECAYISRRYASDR